MQIRFRNAYSVQPFDQTARLTKTCAISPDRERRCLMQSNGTILDGFSGVLIDT